MRWKWGTLSAPSLDRAHLDGNSFVATDDGVRGSQSSTITSPTSHGFRVCNDVHHMGHIYHEIDISLQEASAVHGG